MALRGVDTGVGWPNPSGTILPIVEENLVLRSKSFIDQNPTGQGLSNAIQLVFDPSDITSDDGGLKVHANGDIELLDASQQYIIWFVGRSGRASAASLIDIITWLEVALDGVNFSQPSFSDTVVQTSDTADLSGIEQFQFITDTNLPNGTRYRLKVGRSDSGNNSGGYLAYTPAGSFTGLNSSPSTYIRAAIFETS